MTKQPSLRSVRRLVRPLVGLSCTQAYRGHGTSVIFDFGTLGSVRERGRPMGAYDLWIVSAEWRIEIDDHVVVGGWDDDQLVESALGSLVDDVVEVVRIPQDTVDLSIGFRSGALVRTFRRSAVADHWNLFTPDLVVSASAAGLQLEIEAR